MEHEIETGNRIAVAYRIARWAEAHNFTAEELRFVDEATRRAVSKLAQGSKTVGYTPSDKTWNAVIRMLEAAKAVADQPEDDPFKGFPSA